ncbi:MAG: guanylate kinase [Muribaculaceae bacterium]|nr:guanylate kinase [Muribaculaceae bacterium]
MAVKGKVIIVSAPSGCGKSTIIKAIMSRGDLDLCFSVSATNRAPRPGEVHGQSYCFMSDKEFRKAIDNNLFVEYEEVYPGRFYGTLRSEIDRITSEGHNVVLDIDVNGGLNVKRMLGASSLSLFILPPSVDALRERLIGRATDSAEVIEQRVGRAAYELEQAPHYDCRVVNDNLDEAINETHRIISEFIAS